MLKPEFKLECECGGTAFYLCVPLDGDVYELRCEDCGRSIAHFDRYAIDWVKEKTDVTPFD